MWPFCPKSASQVLDVWWREYQERHLMALNLFQLPDGFRLLLAEMCLVSGWVPFATQVCESAAGGPWTSRCVTAQICQSPRTPQMNWTRLTFWTQPTVPSQTSPSSSRKHPGSSSQRCVYEHFSLSTALEYWKNESLGGVKWCIQEIKSLRLRASNHLTSRSKVAADWLSHHWGDGYRHWQTFVCQNWNATKWMCK